MADDSVTQAYSSLLSRFDALIGTCDSLLVAYSVCQSAVGETCDTADLAGCLKRRNKRMNLVTSRCAERYSQYEGCMRGSSGDCVQELAQLLVCARRELPEH